MNDQTSIASRALDDSSREKALLKAAFDCFATYGFRRTAMNDIAEAAGLSRASLYLHFRNKEDVFRSLIEYYFLAARSRVAAVLDRRGTPTEILTAALAAFDGEEIAAILRSPHGEEFLATKGSTSAALAAEGEAAIAELIAGWLRQAENRGHASLAGFGGDALAFARLLLTAKAGLKGQAASFEDYVAERKRLAQVFGKALAP